MAKIIQYMFNSNLQLGNRQFRWNNIKVLKSHKWTTGTVVVNDIKIAHLDPTYDNLIKLEVCDTNINNFEVSLLVNNAIHYQNSKLFNFNIVLSIAQPIDNYDHHLFESDLIVYTEKEYTFDNRYSNISCKN
jgi:hypothetical protein